MASVQHVFIIGSKSIGQYGGYETFVDKLTEQNKQTNTLLEKERQHSRDLERKLAAKPNYMSTFIIIAIIAAIFGFILAQIIK